MCSIAGYNGYKNAKDILLSTLKKLEYRGYDSAGIALLKQNKTDVIKSEGKLLNLCEKLEKYPISSSVGIGHTRWATHGAATENNAHPHFSEDNKFCVVHNGIIENFQLIKSELEKKGFIFKTDTDTEVIPQLLSYHYDSDILEALQKTVLSLEGSFAICVLCNDEDDTVYCARKESSLNIGRGENENFISSDERTFGKEVNEYTSLEDDEIAVVKKEEILFYDFNLKPKTKTFTKNESDKIVFDKGNFEHFMLKEIYEQPEKIKNLFESHLKDSRFYFEKLPDFKDAERIYIIACGSAYHAALAGKIALEELTRIPAEVEIASEFRYNNPIINNKTPVIIISQSGETADSIAGMRLARKKGAITIGIVNQEKSTIAKECDVVLKTKAGIEVSVATTKGYLTQVAVLYMLSLFIAEKIKSASESEIEYLTKELLETPNKISKVLHDTDKIKKEACKYSEMSDIFFIGRNTDYAAACEGSLKLKEISYINCSAFPAGELKHGTIALINDRTPVIAINANYRLCKKTLSNIEEVFSRGADVFCIATKKTESKKYNSLIIPTVTDIFLPLIEVIPLQLFAYFVAKNKNLNIDMPKNLAKSVTVE